MSGGAAPAIRMSPPAIEQTCKLIAKDLEKLSLQNRPPIVLVSPQIRAALRHMTHAHLPQMIVLSYNEVTRDTAIESVAMVVDGVK